MTGTIYTVTLPDIGEGVVEGEVIEWLKHVGDTLKQDEPVVVVMTDKATVELPAPYPGVLGKQYCQAGQIAIKDKPLYDIQLMADLPDTAARLAEAVVGMRQPCKAPLQPCNVVVQERKRGADKAQAGTAVAIPKVRHLAKELGVDLEAVQGSGKDGRILVQDLLVRSDIQPKVPTATPERFIDSQELPLAGVRGMMAKKMAQAAQIPQFSYFEQAEATRLIQMRQNIKKTAAEEGINLSFMPFFIRALSLCAKKYPVLLSSIDLEARKLFVHCHHNIGIAMASEQGLIVPVLKDVQDSSIEDIIRAYERLKKKVQSDCIEPSEMRGATISISNFGALPGDGKWATPIVNPPEVAILAIGRMRPEAVVRHGEVVVREMIPFSWSFDHRVLDGEQAAAISNYFCTLVRNPAQLL